jgi:hypothetical protein
MLVARPKIEVAPSRTLAVAGAAVATVVLLLGVVMGVRALRGPGEGELVTAPRPSTLTTLVDADWTAGVVGDCLVQSPATDRLSVVACDQPHDLQRFAIGTVTTDASQVDEGCAGAFEAFVGSAPDDSELAIAETRPSTESWKQGDRTFHCYLGVEGRRLTGDARATRW